MSRSAELPFVAAPVGDRSTVEPAALAAARHWGLPQPELLRLGMNAVYTAGDEVVLRVSRPTAPASAAIELAGVLRSHGIRVPSPMRPEPFVLDDGAGGAGPVDARAVLTVLAVERIHAVDAPVDWEAVGAMVRAVHAIDPTSIPTEHPLPRGTSFPWWDLDGLLERVAPQADAGAMAAMSSCLDRHRATLEADRTAATVVCHGDVHPGNVLQSSAGPVLLDWDLLCREPAGWDHAPLMTWTERWGGELGIYEAFAVGYGADLRDERFATAFAELRLLAATGMRVLAGVHDPDAAVEAERRLQWWRGDPSAPTWRAM